MRAAYRVLRETKVTEHAMDEDLGRTGDVIDVIASMATNKNETTGIEVPKGRPTWVKRALLPRISSEAKKKKRY